MIYDNLLAAHMPQGYVSQLQMMERRCDSGSAAHACYLQQTAQLAWQLHAVALRCTH
jgi:hypothetical protein